MTPDARLLLLRHAEPDHLDRCHGRRSDPELSALGHREAHATGLRLRVLSSELGRFTRLVTSPATRAQQTLQPLARTLEREPEVDERWIERDFGDWEGRPWTELWPTTPEEVRRDPTAYAAWTPPGAETPEDVAARTRAAVLDALRGSGTTVVATHAGPIRSAIALALGIPLAATLRIDVAYARVVVLARTQDAITIERLGA